MPAGSCGCAGPTGINSRTTMCGTHEANVYFNQVKHFNNFRNRMDSQKSQKGRGFFSGGVAIVLGRISVYRTGTR